MSAGKKENSISIFDYTDYRVYLKDFYNFKKQHARAYSYRVFSRDGGFSSPNILKLVIDGKRNIGTKSLDQFCRALSLSGIKSQYFKLMVAYDQESQSDKKGAILKEMLNMRPLNDQRLLDMEAFEYLSHWLHPVLREVFELDSVNSDPHWIMRRLTGRLKSKELMKSLAFLADHRFIQKTEGDKLGYETLEKVVSSSDEVKSLAVKNYHKSSLEQARQMIDDLDISEREFGALIVSLPEEAIPELKNKLKEFRRNIHMWALDQAETKKMDAVIQLNFQMYPQFRGKV